MKDVERINKMLDFIDAVNLENFECKDTLAPFLDGVEEALAKFHEALRTLGQEILWQNHMENRRKNKGGD